MPVQVFSRWTAAVVMMVGALALSSLPSSAGLKKSDSEVKVSAVAGKAGADGKQTITITLDVNDGWYIYANPVENADFDSNKTIVTVLADKKPIEAKVDYPKGKSKTTGDFTYSVYTGKVTIQAHVNRPADAKSLDVAIRLSSCNEKGICLLPATIKLNVP